MAVGIKSPMTHMCNRCIRKPNNLSSVQLICKFPLPSVQVLRGNSSAIANKLYPCT